MGTGVIVPFFIEAVYMHKRIKTYEDRRRAIRSFYLAPVIGLILTIGIPVVFFFVLVIGD